MNLENLKIMQSNYLPPLEPIGDFRSYVCGDVVIDQTAAIASGVLIQADQGSRITIAAGVCIGMGAVLHAQDGLLEIGAGANLGAGVLVYGTSKIGEGACIGASSSIVRAVIAKGAIVPPCSLISGLEQSAVEKEASHAIAQELEINNTYTSPTNHSFTHTYSPAKPLGNKFMQGSGFRQGIITENIPDSASDNIIERSTTETYVHTSVTATNESVVANSVERTVTETQVEIPTDAIAEQSLETIDASGNEQIEQIDTAVNPMGIDIAALTTANSAQAKAHAQSQINRFIKRLYPQN
jgi:carbon dioxide concentrating mechanism protein CcmN